MVGDYVVVVSDLVHQLLEGVIFYVEFRVYVEMPQYIERKCAQVLLSVAQHIKINLREILNCYESDESIRSGGPMQLKVQTVDAGGAFSLYKGMSLRIGRIALLFFLYCSKYKSTSRLSNLYFAMMRCLTSFKCLYSPAYILSVSSDERPLD